MNDMVFTALQIIGAVFIVISAIFFIAMINIWRKDEKQSKKILYVIVTSLLVSFTIVALLYGFKMI